MDFLFCWQRVHVSGDVFAGIRWWIKKEATEARLLFRGRTFFIHELIKSLMKSIHNPRAMATERPMKYEPLPTGTCHFQGWFFCSHWCDHCVSFCALPAQTKSVSISRMHVKKTNVSRILNRRTEKKSSENWYTNENFAGFQLLLTTWENGLLRMRSTTAMFSILLKRDIFSTKFFRIPVFNKWILIPLAGHVLIWFVSCYFLKTRCFFLPLIHYSILLIRKVLMHFIRIS